MTPKQTLREKLIAKMNGGGPNNNTDSLSAVVGAVAGVDRRKLKKFLEGDDDSITDFDVRLISSLE